VRAHRVHRIAGFIMGAAGLVVSASLATSPNARHIRRIYFAPATITKHCHTRPRSKVAIETNILRRRVARCWLVSLKANARQTHATRTAHGRRTGLTSDRSGTRQGISEADILGAREIGALFEHRPARSRRRTAERRSADGDQRDQAQRRLVAAGPCKTTPPRCSWHKKPIVDFVNAVTAGRHRRFKLLRFRCGRRHRTPLRTPPQESYIEPVLAQESRKTRASILALPALKPSHFRRSHSPGRYRGRARISILLSTPRRLTQG